MKKIISILIILCMVLIAVTACGDKQKDNTDTKLTESAEKETEKET